MKRQIRQGAFETNSSSTHALNVFNGYRNDYYIPESITVRPGEFGWECDTYSSPEDKLAYLYTWMLGVMSKEEAQEKLTLLLEQAGVKEVEFENCGGYWEDGYIDHSEDLYSGDLTELLDKYFVDYVFNSASYVETGNDNDYEDVSEDPRADWSFYKGN